MWCHVNTRKIIESTKDISKFPAFLVDKYYEINPQAGEKTNEEIFEFINNYRTEENKYNFLTQSLKKH